jgi:hypothetical protein
MRKRSLGLLVAVFLVGILIVACAGPSQEVQTRPVSVVVSTPMVELSKTAKVVFYGTGFAPKQEIQFLFKDSGGVQSIINSALTPDPVPNAEGAWVTVWSCGDYLSLITPGTVVITITDKEYKTLAKVPVAFVAPPKKEAPKEAPKK